MSGEAAPTVSDGTGFSVESLIEQATRAWDEPDESPPETGGASRADEVPPTETGVESGAVAQEGTPADRGDGRDAKGRFAPKGEKEVQDPQDQPAKAADENVDSPTQAPKAEATPETPPGDAVVGEVTASPFTVRFGGKDYGIEGAVRTDTHILIPAAQEETVGRYIGMGLKYETERGQIKQEKAQLSVEREMFTAETGPVMEEVKNLFAICAIQDPNEFAEKFSAYAWELRTSLPLLRERMELSKSRQELEVQRRMAAPDPETVAQQHSSLAFDTAKNHLADWKRDPQTKAMTDEDWRWIEARIQRDPLYFLHRAGERLTAEESEAGVQPGEVYFAVPKLLDVVNTRLEHRRDLVSALEAQKKAVSLAKENAIRQSRTTVPPPPASGGADAAPAAIEENGNKKFGSMAELKKALGVAF